MKKLLFLVLLLCSSLVKAQTYDQSWNEYFSFYNIKDIIANPAKDQIIVATENALFITNSYASEIEKVTTLNGLSGDDISTIAYSDEYHSVLIGYENGLIQVYNTETKKVKTVVDIIQKPTISPEEKKINHFDIYGNEAYIATNYGVSVYNISRLEFGDTYYIGDGGSKIIVNDVVVYNGFVYAATEEFGIKYIESDNKNKIDYAEWESVIPTGNYNFFTLFNNSLFLVGNDTELYALNGLNLNLVEDFHYSIKDLKSTDNNYIALTFTTGARLLDANLITKYTFSYEDINPEFISSVEGLSTQTALSYNNAFYIGDQNVGLLKIYNINDYAEGANSISPNGPLRNDIFSLDLTLGEVWVVYGEYDFNYNPYPLRKRGISHFKEDYWDNFSYKDLLQNHPDINDFRAITSVKINPANPDQVFLGSFYDGLMLIENEEVSKVFTVYNSNLPQSEGLNTDEIRLSPIGISPAGSIWMGIARNEEGLIELPAGGGNNSFKKYKMNSVLATPNNNQGFGDMSIDRSNNVYIASAKDGVVGYNPSNKKFARIKGGKDQGNLPDGNNVRALALDENQQLWIGTSRGLRVLYNPSRMFEDPNLSASNIVFKDESGVAQELFAGLAISDIQVDGNNNKWVGSTSGVYQVSADGQKTFHHFTTENSPLPSNDINSIKINPNTGEVFIATKKGLVGFRGSAKGARDDLKQVRAYPNPVRPGYEGMVVIDGLMNKSNVKITDIEGNLVYEEFSQGGSIEWDTRAFGRYKVASGVYLVLITSEDQSETKVTKIMIIR